MIRGNRVVIVGDSTTVVSTFEEYFGLLLELLAVFPEGETTLLVGHSLGGLSLALCIERFPERVEAAVFATAVMPDCVHHHYYSLGQVLTVIGNFCIFSIAIRMLIDIVVIYPIQHRRYRECIEKLLVLLLGGIPIVMPTVLSVTMAIGSHRLSEQGAITKRMMAIEEMADLDVLCSDKTRTLTLNKLGIDNTLIEVFVKDVSIDAVVLYIRYR